jgi:signal transduction histidine kinase
VKKLAHSAFLCDGVNDTPSHSGTEHLEEVFAPFVRLEKSRNDQTGGVGLGLLIARAVARQHGADVLLRARSPGLEAVLSLPA